MFILNLDITIVNIALPRLGRVPDATNDKLQWVIAAYALSAAVAVIPSGALLDKYGPRRVLSCAALLFGVSSLLAALSPSATALIVARVIMGLGSAAILTGSIATLTLYYQGSRRQRVFGIWSACAAIGLSVGPLVGGWLLSVADWEVIFLINVPFCALAVIFIARTVPASSEVHKNKIDVLSISLLSLVLLSGVAGLIEFGAERVFSALILTACCVVSGGLFLTRQRGKGPRLLDPGVLTSGTMLVPLFVLIALFTVMAVLLFLLPSSFELALGQDPFSASLHILALPLSIAVAAIFGGHFLHKLPAWMTMCWSLGTTAIGLIILMFLDPARPSLIVFVGLVCIGIGVGLGQPAALQTAVSAFPPAQRGIGSGFVNSLRLASNAGGAAIAGSIVSLTVSRADPSLSANSLIAGASSCRSTDTADVFGMMDDLCVAYVDGLRLTLMVAFLLVIAAAVVVILREFVIRRDGARMMDARTKLNN
ncbi:MFS transporter [Rathayibacter iranicus]|uniref:MFS transporter n=1 Tax=Rathayibacter iranicus TaxID=59737 RepID=UPI00132C8BD9|nr:MFS transporter [Rathayibacter iranicus]MWV31184.1 MFS transporter [Rathayibacter iranicus NCPPB 2253 = VKM Ac-1602]